ncbi:DNA helicase [Clostridium estertheticum]|uniref:helicase-related protein n=1 Tax=Clostridium estertheticum TaxID=238834 RepID=UPI001C0CA401|nr:helicase-related protein [Clostridium estertheticum]MBU3177654.1 DNA helicase [Clostridium estertheticum]
MKTENVSQLVTSCKVSTWGNGEVITIKAGTGVGKSYFIKNTLYKFAQANNKRILMLIHRLNCTDQFKLELEKDKKSDIIDIKTYQSLENANKKDFDFSVYDYIVCDEFHYFLSDSLFNIFTDVSLTLILGQTKSIRIFMSATGDYMKRYINDTRHIKTRDYELPIDFKFIEKLNFYNNDETVEKLIEEAIEKGDKVIIFIQFATKAYELYKKYKKHCLFNCGKSDKHYKYVDKDKIKEMLINERFEELILITTTCMDAGVNIHDKKVNKIICDVIDIGVLIQCIGRKRLGNINDKIYLYIKTINNSQLSGMKTQLKLKVSKADFLRDHTIKEYLKKFIRQNDYSNIVYAESIAEDNKSTHKINELMYFKCKLDIIDIITMLS